MFIYNFSSSLFEGQGKAEYTLKDVYDSDFELRMFEDLYIFDTKPADDIEMCNGTATNTRTGELGKQP